MPVPETGHSATEPARASQAATAAPRAIRAGSLIRRAGSSAIVATRAPSACASLRSLVRERAAFAFAHDAARAVGRPAARGFGQRGFRERQAHDQHAVVQQRQQHPERRRLLAAMHRAARREGAGRLAGKHAREPQARGAVEERHERRRHVAESHRAPQHEPRAFAQVVVRRQGRALRRRAVGAGRAERRHRAQACAATRDAVDAACHLARELGGRAVAAVIENQDVRHRALPSFWSVHRLERHGF